eukprot:1458044-Rhodomonas_salina.4
MDVPSSSLRKWGPFPNLELVPACHVARARSKRGPGSTTTYKNSAIVPYESTKRLIGSSTKYEKQ